MRIFRRRSGNDFIHHNGFAWRWRRLPRLRNAHLDSQISPDNPAFLEQTLERSSKSVGRNRKADSLRAAAARNDRSIDADDFTAQVDEGAAAVPRIDRGIRFD